MLPGFKDFLNKTVSDAKTTFNRAQQVFKIIENLNF